MAPRIEHGRRLQDQRRRHRPTRLGHRRRRRHDPARHLRRGGQRHRAGVAVGQRQHHDGVEQLRQALDRYLPAAQRQRDSPSRCRTASTATSPWAPRARRPRSGPPPARAAARRRRPAGCVTADPLYDPTDFTPGGGDTGTVLISPLIKPGTVSSTYYNHYSTLRTLEDLFLTGTVLHRAVQRSTRRWPPARSAAASTARATSATRRSPAWPTSGPTCSPRTGHSVVPAPPGYSAVSGSGTSALYCPNDVNLGPGTRSAIR